MKKAKILKISIAVILLSVLAVVIVLSFSDRELYKMALNNLSEERHDFLVGDNGSVKASFMTGKRESEYLINGFHTPSVEYGVVTFVVSESVNTELVRPEYTVTVGTKKYAGVLEKSPIDGSYVADIGKIVSTDEQVVVRISEGGFVQEVPLTSVIKDWKLDYKGALKLACDELKDELQSFIVNKEFAGEVYIRTVNNKDFDEQEYYWYVSFVNRDAKQLAVIINPNTKEILAKQSTLV